MSGARQGVLARAPSERARFVGLGGAVLSTSVIAGCSFTFALSTILGVSLPLALLGGIVWGAGIMGLDRWLVTSMPSSGGGRTRIAIPRLLLALLLGAVISTPVVLQIFNPEIKAEIVQIQRERGDAFVRDQKSGDLVKEVAAQQAVVDDLYKVIRSKGSVPLDPAKDPDIQFLTGQLNTETKKRDSLYADWQCQLLGIPSASLPKCVKGDGDLAKAAEKEYNASVRRVAATKEKLDDRRTKISRKDDSSNEARLKESQGRVSGEEARLQQLKDQQNALTTSFGHENKGSQGLLLQIEALNRASGGNGSLALVRFVLFLLFLTIECLPLAVKLMQKPGLYEELFDRAVEKDRQRALDDIDAMGFGDDHAIPITQIWDGDDETARWSDDQPPTEVVQPRVPPPAGRPVFTDEADLLHDMSDAVDVQPTRVVPTATDTQPDSGFRVDDDR